MVEIITRYRASDGREFDTRADAERHEVEAGPRMLAEIIATMTDAEIVAVLVGRATNPALANALEKAGGIVTRARLAAGERKRPRKAHDAKDEQAGSGDDGAED